MGLVFVLLLVGGDVEGGMARCLSVARNLCSRGVTIRSTGNYVAFNRVGHGTLGVTRFYMRRGVFGRPIYICLPGSGRVMADFINAGCDKGFCIPLSVGSPSAHVQGVLTALGPKLVVASRRRGSRMRGFNLPAIAIKYLYSHGRTSLSMIRSTEDERVSASPMCSVFASNSANVPGKMIVSRHNIVSCVS